LGAVRAELGPDYDIRRTLPQATGHGARDRIFVRMPIVRGSPGKASVGTGEDRAVIPKPASVEAWLRR